jgi:hypothetical protein
MSHGRAQAKSCEGVVRNECQSSMSRRLSFFLISVLSGRPQFVCVESAIRAKDRFEGI